MTAARPAAPMPPTSPRLPIPGEENTALPSTARAASTPRRLPTPSCEPPYDDELAATRRPRAMRRPGGTAQDGQQALDLGFRLMTGVPASPEAPTRLRVVRSAPVEDDGDFARQPTPRAALPDPGAWAGRFVQGLLEVLAGSRPPTQLLRWSTSEVYASIQRRAQISAGAGPVRGFRPLVRSVRVCEPDDGVAEVTAVIQRAGRVHAVAMRLEGIDGRWQCTVLQVA